MSPATILERIRGLFASDTSEHLDRIGDAFENDRQHEPAHPMSDEDLARAIRTFQGAEVSDPTVAKLSRRFIEAPEDG